MRRPRRDEYDLFGAVGAFIEAVDRFDLKGDDRAAPVARRRNQVE
jgi:hypothetical protein